MKKASEYREHARECYEMADRAAGEQKSMLLTMAQTWESLADDREEHLARQKRLAALEMMGN